MDRFTTAGMVVAPLLSSSVAVVAAAEAAATQEQQQPEPKPKPPSPTPTPLDPSQKSGAEPEIKVSLKDGVHFKSADGNFDIILGGYTGIHWRVVAQRPQDNLRTSPDTWYLRQVRPELSGFIYKDFDFRIQLDFPMGPAAIDGTRHFFGGILRFQLEF